MKSLRLIPVVTGVLALALTIPLAAGSDGHDDHDKDKAPLDALVNFGDPVTLAGAANQVLVPDEATIRKGGTVTFVVNGGGHGIAIYPVSKDTTRDDITAQLCPHNPTCLDATFANADHTIRDGRNNIVIVTGTNPPFQRVDDPTDRLLATSTQLGNLAGVFLTGTTATTTATQLQVRFDKKGRYLAVCMNRNHYLANWMFGFINVEDDGHHD
jgi:plastocyanin